MADVTITAANVDAPTPGISTGVSGEAISIGDVLYADSSDSNKLKKAQADGTAAEATVVGIAMNTTSAADQHVGYATSGALTLGSGLTQGEVYFVSGTAGGIAPDADIATSNWYRSYLGVASSTTVLQLKIHNSTAQIP